MSHRRLHLAARLFRGTLTAAWESVVTWVIIAVAIVAVTVLFVVQNDTVNALRSRNQSLGSQVVQANGRYDQLFAQYKDLYKQSTEEGVTPTAPDPTAIPDKATSGATGPTGAAGLNGRNGADGRGVVGASCTGSGLELFYSDGTSGDVGTCVGPRGAVGKTGQTGEAGQAGADSTVAGPTGATGATGAAGATGSTGAAGKDGTDGKDGRSVSSMTCNADGTWTITYSDSTTSTTDGPCRVDPILPIPTPTGDAG